MSSQSNFCPKVIKTQLKHWARKMLLTNLMFDEDFIVLGGDFRASEGDVKASVRLMNFANTQATLVMSATDIQWLSGAGASTDDSQWRNWTVSSWNPGGIAICQHFEIVLWNLLSIPADVSHVLAWHVFSGNLIALVECTADIDWSTVTIVATENSAFRQWSVSRSVRPGRCKEKWFLSEHSWQSNHSRKAYIFAGQRALRIEERCAQSRRMECTSSHGIDALCRVSNFLDNGHVPRTMVHRHFDCLMTQHQVDNVHFRCPPRWNRDRTTPRTGAWQSPGRHMKCRRYSCWESLWPAIGHHHGRHVQRKLVSHRHRCPHTPRSVADPNGHSNESSWSLKMKVLSQFNSDKCDKIHPVCGQSSCDALGDHVM